MHRHSTAALLAVTILVAVAIGCSEDRERDGAGGVHPIGWTDPQGASFHGTELRTTGYPLDECRGCHGDDFGGGAVEVACSNGSCHEQGVDFCGTCHGGPTGPLPSTGAHTTHRDYCAECHTVPRNLVGHPRGAAAAAVQLTGLAAAGGFAPQWNAGARSCSSVYCHAGDSPVWDDTTPLGCDGCHATSTIHARFSRVVAPETCADCHQGSPAVGHLDGQVSIAVDRCDACHGAGSKGAPPVGLDGSADATSPGVGAHRRHLDSQLAGRVSKAVRCESCHRVPATILATGHLDTTSPADVVLPQGSYAPAAQTCTVWCHVDATPVWTDDSGAARACDGCHGFPPLMTTGGSPHPGSPPQLSECEGCHSYELTTHVDGVTTFR